MDARAIRIPILALVFPKASAILSPIPLFENILALASSIPESKAYLYNISGVVNAAVANAANNNDITGCNLNRMIPISTMEVPITMTKKGFKVKGDV